MKWLLIYHAPTVGWVSQLYGSQKKALDAGEEMEKYGADFAAVIDLDQLREDFGNETIGIYVKNG